MSMKFDKKLVLYLAHLNISDVRLLQLCRVCYRDTLLAEQLLTSLLMKDLHTQCYAIVKINIFQSRIDKYYSIIEIIIRNMIILSTFQKYRKHEYLGSLKIL